MYENHPDYSKSSSLFEVVLGLLVDGWWVIALVIIALMW